MDDAFPIQKPIEARARRLSVDDFVLLSEHGHLRTEVRHELINGAIYEMASEGVAHIDYKNEIILRVARTVFPPFRPLVESQLNLPPHSALVPDISIVPEALKTADIKGSDVLLVIEVADSSLKADLQMKAPVYAAGGIREYWVVDIPSRQILVHRERTEEGGWAAPVAVAAHEAATCAAIPELTLRLDDFERLKPGT